jgi:two-component system response regulator PilR (NtrC family)
MDEKNEMKSTASARVLIVDDEEGMRNYLSVVLRKAGHQVSQAVDGVAAVEVLGKERFDVILEDLKMPRLDGLALLRLVQKDFPETVVVVMTAYSTWESAVEAMRLGAFNYIRKPFDNDEIRSIVVRAWEASQARRRNDSEGDSFVCEQIIGNTPVIRNIHEMIRRVAPTDSTICIQGESGTGKELVARAIHYYSNRRCAPFIAVNCSAFTDSLLESELFGHVKGAFTGAISDKQGLFDVARGGTFFLDEMADMSRPLQAKLLRALEEREMKPVGATETLRIDVRVIAATNKSLEDEVARGNFREDLFYRLNVIPIKLPPLRERKGDIPFLVGHFLGKYASSMNKPVTGIGKAALDLLFTHDWRGNVRELDNAIQRAVALARGAEITPEDLSEKISTGVVAARPASTDDTLIPPGGLKLEDHLEAMERSYITEALKRCDHVVTRAADLLHIDVRALRYRIKKLGLRPPAESPGPQPPAML